MPRFGPVLTAMVTPFGRDGALDLGMAADLARFLVDNGNDGLVVAGTTGEAPTLTQDEQIALIGAVARAVKVPVLAGTGSNDTRSAVSNTERAQDAGAAGVLVVSPYYNRPSQAGLLGHFRAVAAATALPVILYDIPVRTGRKVETETILELARTVPNVVGLKDAAGNPAETARLIAQAPDGFEVVSGDDALTLPLLAVGAVGVIGVATHWSGKEHQDMIAAFMRGEVAEARRINAALLPSYAFETSLEAPNPIPSKVMMRILGLEVGAGRPPMDGEPEGLDVRARSVLSGLSLGAR